jgi:hypothetical protein
MRSLVDGGIVICSIEQASSARQGLCKVESIAHPVHKIQGQHSTPHLALCGLAADAQ